MADPWSHPLLVMFQEQVAKTSEADFVAANQAPFLLYVAMAPASRQMLDTRQLSDAGGSRHAPTTSRNGANTRVATLAKSDRNPFAGKVYVGRATNNDIVIEDASVSKTHAYFEQGEDGRWCLCDIGSSNGTKHESRALGPNSPVALADGQRIDLGGVAATLLFPAAFYRFVRGQLGESLVSKR